MTRKRTTKQLLNWLYPEEKSAKKPEPRTKQNKTPEPKLRRVEIVQLINSIKPLKHKALFSFLYLTACRVQEATKYFKIKDMDNIIQYGKPCYSFHLYTEKKRKTTPESELYRDIFVPCASEPELIKNIQDYIDFLKLKESQEKGFTESAFFEIQPFKINRSYVWFLCKKKLGMRTHWLRHLRCTHLVNNYSFNVLELKEWQNWASVEESNTYVKVNRENIIKKQLGVL